MKQFMEKKNSLANLSALLVFGIFAVCVMLVLLQGADTYRKIQERGQDCFEQRTAMQFLSVKIHQADGVVRLASLGDGEALIFAEEFDGETYETWIYCYDGWLREYFCVSGEKPILDFGEMVLKADSLSMNLKGELLQIRMTDGAGTEHSMQMYLRSGGEEAAYEE